LGVLFWIALGVGDVSATDILVVIVKAGAANMLLVTILRLAGLG
jgi:hypothetical protein